jgi:hypothetical protein
MFSVGNVAENRLIELSDEAPILTEENVKVLEKYFFILRDGFIPLEEDIAFEDKMRQLIREKEVDLDTLLVINSSEVEPPRYRINKHSDKNRKLRSFMAKMMGDLTTRGLRGSPSTANLVPMRDESIMLALTKQTCETNWSRHQSHQSAASRHVQTPQTWI